MASANWNNNFFQKSSNTLADYSHLYKTLGKQDHQNYDWSLFNLTSGQLGKREMRINRNLMNPKEFAAYWQTGKHKNHTIHKGYDPEEKKDIDLDGDGVTPDYYAVDPEGVVVGFNDKYITDIGSGETPYRKKYYELDRDARSKQSYMEFLDTQSDVEGWRPISKIRDNRGKSVWNIIKSYLETEFAKTGATLKEVENVCKQLLKIIQTSFFTLGENGVPMYQMKTITESPEFKKILNSTVTATTIKNYLPEGGKSQIVNGMLQLIRGYGSNIKDNILGWLNTNQNSHRISKENAEQLYKSIIIKKAANKLYKEYGLTAAEAANNQELFNKYKAALEKEQQALHAKYSTQTYDLK